MSAVALLAATAVLAVLAAWGKPALTFGVLLATVLLVPATVLLPGTPSAVVTVPRVVELAAVVGTVLATRRSPSTDRRPWPLVLFVLIAYLAVTAVTGVGLADTLTPPVPAAYAWVGLGEQAVLLVLALSLARLLTARTVIVLAAALAAGTVLVGLLEAATGTSWSRLVFHAVRSQLGSVQAQPLEHRQGHLRIRGAADFALEYGWMLVALLPLTAAAAVAAARRGRRVRAAAASLVAVALGWCCYLSRTRSSLAAFLVVAVVLAVVFVPRRRAGYLLIAAGAAVGALAVGPTLAAALSPAAGQGSIDVRLERLPQVLALAAHRPLQGIGLTGIQRLGIAGYDSSFVRAYVETGALASVLLTLTLLAAVAAAGRGLIGRPLLRLDSDDRLLAMAVTLSLLALVLSATTFDAFSVLGSTRLFWLLCGAGVAAADRIRGPARLPSVTAALTVPRVALVLLAVGAGFAVRAAAPTHVAAEAVFATLDLRTEVHDDPPGMGRTLVTTTCHAATDIAQLDQPWRTTRCAEAGPPGWGRLRVEAGTRSELAGALQAIAQTAHALPGLQSLRMSPAAVGAVAGKPAAAEVAPAVLGLLAAFGAVVVRARGEQRVLRRNPAGRAARPGQAAAAR